jgi:hypothetical protein
MPLHMKINILNGIIDDAAAQVALGTIAQLLL